MRAYVSNWSLEGAAVFLCPVRTQVGHLLRKCGGISYKKWKGTAFTETK